ncbi:MAG: hypothetical protein E5V75_29315 [Mesorhizobium sp.]|nr:MAG: hypothetical protein E5V75_29315 [Mesorhizobium sp.]
MAKHADAGKLPSRPAHANGGFIRLPEEHARLAGRAASNEDKLRKAHIADLRPALASSVWDDNDGTRRQKSRAKFQAAPEAGGVVLVGETEERAPGLVHIIGP